MLKVRNTQVDTDLVVRDAGNEVIANMDESIIEMVSDGVTSFDYIRKQGYAKDLPISQVEGSILMVIQRMYGKATVTHVTRHAGWLSLVHKVQDEVARKLFNLNAQEQERELRELGAEY